MLAFKLAYRNLIGAKLRTWLNVFVLSLCYIIIIWHKGFLDGWNIQAQRDTINWEIGGGQYWHENYDPYDPFTIEDSHGRLSDATRNAIRENQLTPVLISRGSMYPNGRMQSVLFKGIDPLQTILELPTSYLNTNIEEVPAIIGRRLAKNNKLSVGDYVTIRWRDSYGTFDAAEIKIVHIFNSDVPGVDVGLLWIPLERHREMMRMPGEATILVADKEHGYIGTIMGFEWKGHDVLLAEIRNLIKAKSIGGSVLYIILLFLAMLAIFDTQVLSIFRRQKEIGTHVALGMTQRQVVALFTIEGAMYAVLAALAGAVYGIPLLAMQAVKGFSMPASADDYGLAIAETIYPYYSFLLVVGTVFIILITTTIVSYIPARRISKMKPADALRGKIQ